MIYPGDKLYGYCAGRFGRDGYGPHVVVAVGRDWVVCRGGCYGDGPYIGVGDPEELTQFLTPEEDDQGD